MIRMSRLSFQMKIEHRQPFQPAWIVAGMIEQSHLYAVQAAGRVEYGNADPGQMLGVDKWCRADPRDVLACHRKPRDKHTLQGICLYARRPERNASDGPRGHHHARRKDPLQRAAHHRHSCQPDSPCIHARMGEQAEADASQFNSLGLAQTDTHAAQAIHTQAQDICGDTVNPVSAGSHDADGQSPVPCPAVVAGGQQGKADPINRLNPLVSQIQAQTREVRGIADADTVTAAGNLPGSGARRREQGDQRDQRCRPSESAAGAQPDLGAAKARS